MTLLGNPEFRQSIVLPDKKLHWLNTFLHSFDLFERRSAVLFLPVLAAIAVTYTAPYLFWRSFLLAGFLGSILALDILLIFLLPHLRISFPAPTSQLVTLSVPRIGLLSLCLLLKFFGFDSTWPLTIGMVAGSCLYIWGMLLEPAQIVITNRRIASPALSRTLKLLHLSDLHIERISRREIDIARYTKEQRPDFVFVTGDFLNLSNVMDPVAQKDLQAFLRELTQYSSVICSLGSPPVDDRKTLPALLLSAGVTLLRDQILRIPLSNGNCVNIAGIDCDHRQRLDTQVFKNLESLFNSTDFNVLLFHSPEIMPTVRESLVDLYLCGHTHGGQIRAPWYGAILTSSVTGKSYEKGLYQNGRTHLYVSAGIGLEGRAAPRMRLLCRPEAIMWTVAPAFA